MAYTIDQELLTVDYTRTPSKFSLWISDYNEYHDNIFLVSCNKAGAVDLQTTFRKSHLDFFHPNFLRQKISINGY